MCGRDGNNYYNKCHLECAEVERRHKGTCATMDYEECVKCDNVREEDNEFDEL